MRRRIAIITLVIYWALLVSLTYNAYADPINISYREAIKLHIKKNEGWSNEVYLDSKGNLTVGYGHKLHKDSNLEVGDYIPSDILNRWFNNDFNIARKCAIKFFNTHNPDIAMVLTDMAFNMGCTNLNEFKLLNKHLNNRDYVMAAKAIRGSNYYRQVTNRAKRNIAIVRQQINK